MKAIIEKQLSSVSGVPVSVEINDMIQLDDAILYVIHWSCNVPTYNSGNMGVIVYTDGTMFTQEDWQGGFPETAEEIENFEWVDRNNKPAIVLNGQPRTMLEDNSDLSRKYPNCYMCDNIVDSADEIGLLYLGNPRCFILIDDIADLYQTDYESFKDTAKIQWLDPSQKHSDEEKERVVRMLWNFSIECEEADENYIEEFD